MEANDDIYDTSQLTFEGDFDDQVQEIMQRVRLTRQEVENLQVLLDDLYQALTAVWPGCKVNGFGSIVTGLGIKTSDVDCYVQLPSWLSPPDDSFVLKARNVLRRQHWIFQKLFAITTAKIPIVKFYHGPTNRSCDVNFTSPAGVRNSELIGYFLEKDYKLLHLAILIKYWAKFHNLTGLNYMPNYCLTLLVIFYLQQKNILPSVRDIQCNVDELFVDNWNTAFGKARHTTFVNEALYQLLGGFFKYYSTFKFSKHIVCPYLGRPVDRELFLKPEKTPPDFSLYKLNIESDSQCKPIRLDTFMCVQDPFEHNRNCAVAVHPKLAQNIISHFRKATDVFENDHGNSFLKKILTKTVENKPPVPKKPKNKPATQNGIKKQYKTNQNIKQSVKFITQNYFKARNGKKWR